MNIVVEVEGYGTREEFKGVKVKNWIRTYRVWNLELEDWKERVSFFSNRARQTLKCHKGESTC
jgi:hypothetical protein